jgi:hypothetical protein
MEEYKISQGDFIDWIEGNIEDRIIIIKKMKPNTYLVYDNSILSNIKRFDLEIESLKENGLDIGKGNCQYGYRMPIPKKGEGKKLIIFRR